MAGRSRSPSAQGRKSDLWTLHAAPGERARGRQSLAGGQGRRCSRGWRLAPDQPLLLNFLGYAKLERGEDIDAAEAMIRKASELAPDDASITDSLGWAQFKRGKIG